MITHYRQELKGRILATAMREFSAKGISRVKMDDIAHELGISKRTLYELYSDKETLLLEGILASHQEANEHITAYAEQAEHNAMDIIMESYHTQMASIAEVSPVFFNELERYPRIAEYFEAQREQREREMYAFFERGIQEGYFLADLNYEIISSIGRAAVDYVMRDRMYERYRPDEIFRNVFTLLIRGFCTEKGIAQIDGHR